MIRATLFSLLTLCCLGLFPFSTSGPSADAAEPPVDPLVMLVMDPLAAPLSCPCVEGYAQRKYEVLAEHLKAHLGGRDITLIFGESLTIAKKKLNGATPDLIIGKDSVVRSDVQKEDWQFSTIARLTDKSGSTDQHGLIVVPTKSPAQSAADLRDYHIVFGPADCAEKHQAAIALLEKVGVPIPTKLEIDAACSDGASRVVELGPTAKAAAVISSYAAPLLEGCGTIKKGDLRVVGKTEPVPFVTAFTNDAMTEGARQSLNDALLTVASKPELCAALESLIGFVPVEDGASKKK